MSEYSKDEAELIDYCYYMSDRLDIFIGFDILKLYRDGLITRSEFYLRHTKAMNKQRLIYTFKNIPMAKQTDKEVTQ